MKIKTLILIITFYSCVFNPQSKIIYEINEVDMPPQFYGGETKMELFIKENLKWPSEDFGYSGNVIINAKVNEDGQLDSIRIKKSLCSFCDNEAKRVVSIMPDWKPAIKNNKIVKCRIDIPIRFEMKN